MSRLYAVTIILIIIFYLQDVFSLIFGKLVTYKPRKILRQILDWLPRHAGCSNRHLRLLTLWPLTLWHWPCYAKGLVPKANWFKKMSGYYLQDCCQAFMLAFVDFLSCNTSRFSPMWFPATTAVHDCLVHVAYYGIRARWLLHVIENN